MENKITKITKENIFIEHIVHCLDLDSRDEFNTIVLINEKVTDQSRIIELCEQQATKDERVILSGNSFEYEYLQPSGRIVKEIKVITREELHSRDKESEELIKRNHID